MTLAYSAHGSPGQRQRRARAHHRPQADPQVAWAAAGSHTPVARLHHHRRGTQWHHAPAGPAQCPPQRDRGSGRDALLRHASLHLRAGLVSPALSTEQGQAGGIRHGSSPCADRRVQPVVPIASQCRRPAWRALCRRPSCLVLLRDPALRAASHWAWCLRQCGETRSFRDAVEAEIGAAGDGGGLRIPPDKTHRRSAGGASRHLSAAARALAHTLPR